MIYVKEEGAVSINSKTHYCIFTFKKVKTMPPPKMSLSTLLNMASMTEILEETCR